MKTYKELKDFCEKNNVRYEIHEKWSKPYYLPFSHEEHRTLLGFVIGMNNIAGRKGRSEWQWTWFETMLCPDKLEDDTKFTFTHRYSMVNGKYYKGFQESWNAEETIERRMR